jgi:hypothetical protein
MIAVGLLEADHVRVMQLDIPGDAKKICLSLPETVERRKLFQDESPDSIFIFNGIRMSPGWIGAGLSFLSLARHCVERGHQQILIMEDDVILPNNYLTTIGIVEEYLNSLNGEWDSFSGLIADLNRDVKVTNVQEYKGIKFVTIDKMTSTVFNYYSKGFMRKLLLWDSKNMNAETNTIDRFIESTQDLRVIVALPFLAGHREDTNSVLWGFNNARYRSMIQRAESDLNYLVEEFEQKTKYRILP